MFRFESRRAMHRCSFPDGTQMSSQAVHLLLRGEDKAFLELAEDDLLRTFYFMSVEADLEPEGPVKNEAAAFVDRLGHIVSAARMFEKLRDAVIDALVLDAPSPGMLPSVREASEALRRAVAAAKADALSMRRALWAALPPAERELRLDALSRRVDRIDGGIAASDDLESRGDPVRIADLMAARSSAHVAMQPEPMGDGLGSGHPE